MFSANSSQVSDDKLFVEDVFSTYLYTGNGSSQTITNGIDLAGKGGLVWLKQRSAVSWTAWTKNFLCDTTRGAGKALFSDATSAQDDAGLSTLASFASTGFTLGNDSAGYGINKSTETYASWTFREAPKFFDVVTYTGNGANRNIAHNLGVAPGMIIVKRTDAAADWQVYHRSTGNTQYTVLNSTAAAATGATRWNNTTPTATEFTVGTDATVNASGGIYVAYLFAHDPTADGIIQCGSFTTDGSANATVNLGYEPQWAMVKASSGAGDWWMNDVMRAWDNGGIRNLYANTATAESGYIATSANKPTASGFTFSSNANTTYIYVAIRRPMKTPTLGTSVFAPVTRTGTGATVYTTTSGFAPDSVWMDARSQSGKGPGLFDRLRGLPQLLQTTTTSSEVTNAGYIRLMGNTGYTSNADAYYNTSSQTFVDWIFRRAPGFFDEVCYTGTGVLGRTVAHNLGVAPEMIIVKRRSAANDWGVYHSALGNTKLIYLNYNLTPYTAINWWNNTTPTASVFTVGDQNENNASGSTYVSYLFASCPGVSKVGSYTGNGSSQTINCGFAAGARFVMIKRTDSTGDWYVWDTARGIVAGNDPHLSLNTTAAEVTTDDTIDTDSSGFVVNQDAATNVNVNAATYIYLAIA